MPRTDLRELFANLQGELQAKLRSGRALPHSGVQGEVSEESWIAMLEDQLPRRYGISRAMVVDCEGETSEQIDIVIHDRQYSPLLFRRGAQLFVPAESVYAVLEVKPQLDAGTLAYAADKAASVRRLRRTNARIPHAGGVVEAPKPPFEILAGIVSDRSGWSPMVGESLRRNLEECRGERRIDLGCALADGAFAQGDGAGDVETAPGESALVFFFVSLLDRLQRLGTVPAIDYAEYRRVLDG
jgi:hypothetical protein